MAKDKVGKGGGMEMASSCHCHDEAEERVRACRRHNEGMRGWRRHCCIIIVREGARDGVMVMKRERVGARRRGTIILTRLRERVRACCRCRCRCRGG